MQPIDLKQKTQSLFRTTLPLSVNPIKPMDEEQKPPVSSTAQFNIKPDGEVKYTGEVVTPESQAVIQDLLRQSEYYRLKAHQLEQEKLKKQSGNDAVVVIFTACVLSLVIFSGYAIITSLTNQNQSPKIQETPTDVQ